MPIEMQITQALTAAQVYLATLVESPTQIVAHLAAALAIGLVVAGAFVRTMTPLRWLVAGGNLGLLVYGALHPAPTTLVIAALLLPINLYRALEVTRLTRRVRHAGVAAELAALWLRPHMKARKYKAGTTLFNKGDAADRLYLLVQGRMVLADIDQPLATGRIFGEIALFSPQRVRTHTVRCVSACVVLDIHESTVRQLFYQHPAFAFHLVELLAANYSADLASAERRLAALPGT